MSHNFTHSKWICLWDYCLAMNHRTFDCSSNYALILNRFWTLPSDVNFFFNNVCRGRSVHRFTGKGGNAFTWTLFFLLQVIWNKLRLTLTGGCWTCSNVFLVDKIVRRFCVLDLSKTFPPSYLILCRSVSRDRVWMFKFFKASCEQIQLVQL